MQREYDLYFYVKRDCLLFSVNVKLFFEFFVMREKANYFCVKVFSEEVLGTLGFRKGRECTDQIFTLRKIPEQCTEWNRQLYVNFIDYEKAFDSIHRDSLWQILRALGIPQPEPIVNTIKCFYWYFTCCVGQGDLRPEYGRDVSFRLCYSILLSIGFFIAR